MPVKALRQEDSNSHFSFNRMGWNVILLDGNSHRFRASYKFIAGGFYILGLANEFSDGFDNSGLR
jgi:hypothetical protein